MAVLGSRVWRGIFDLPAAAQRALLHSLLFGFALSVAELLFNFYLVSLGYGADVAGLFSTTMRLAGVALGLPAGLLIDRIGARRALIGSMLAYAGSWCVMLAGSALPVLLGAQLLIGGAYTVAMAAIVTLLASAATTDTQARLFGLNASALLVIGLLGNAVGGVLPTLAGSLLDVDPQSIASYRLAMVAVIVLALTAALPLLRMPLAAPELASHRAVTSIPRRRLTTRQLLRLGLASIGLGAGAGWFLPFQNLFFRQQFGLSDGSIGAVLGWMALAMGLGALLGAPLSQRLGQQRASALLRALAAPAMVLLAFVPLLGPAIAALVLRGVGVCSSYPLYDSLVMNATPPRQRGVSAGILNLTWALGWAVSSALSGIIQVRYGFTPVALASALCYLLSAWSIFTLRLPE